MPSISKTIEVAVPVRTAYDQWTQFEEFPRFMDGVDDVKQLDDKRLHWKATVGGKLKEWDAEIVEQRPDEIISWRSTSGAKNEGTVTFQPSAKGAKVTLRLEYEPEGVAEKAGDVLGVLDRQVQSSLERFKKFIESRRTETGAWRGTIEGSRVEEPTR
ncbi:MAG: hypothetical protein QOH08_1504 [Chloroflexota bacterium]|jgi:uncharacterized membrane protein|nr:hypothetical protein [Chloroflexota bacterium]